MQTTTKKVKPKEEELTKEEREELQSYLDKAIDYPCSKFDIDVTDNIQNNNDLNVIEYTLSFRNVTFNEFKLAFGGIRKLFSKQAKIERDKLRRK